MKKLSTLAAVLFLLFGCGDKITNNYYGMGSGTITGRIDPVDPGTIISVGDGEYQTKPDDEGYFVLSWLPVGIYHLTVRPVNYSRREIGPITMAPDKLVNIGDITLSTYPYPIYRTSPADGVEEVSYRSSIAIYADEALDLESLNAGAVITPSVEGTWEEKSSSGYLLSYRFNYGNERLKIGRTYSVTIDADVQTKNGEPLGEDVSFSFQIAPLSVYVSIPRPGATGATPILGFDPQLRFLELVHIDSVSAAVSFSPEIEGTWLIRSYPSDPNQVYSNQFTFFPDEPQLSPETDYMLIIGDQVSLTEDGQGLARPDTTFFTTEAYGVTRVSPSFGYRISPGIPNIILFFNTVMDTATISSAFALIGPEDQMIPGQIDWLDTPRTMRFKPDDSLAYGIHYITLDTTACLADGQPISKPFESYFIVQ